MANVVYKSLSSLAPIELKYQYYRDEKIISEPIEYQEGYSMYKTKGFSNFQDVAINRDSCLVLTSAVDLNNVFENNETASISEQPSTVTLQPRNSLIYYIKHQPLANTFVLALTSFSHFFIQPVSNSSEVELMIEGKYVQVDEEYPYVVRLNERPLDPESVYRQRFLMHLDQNLITLKTKTNSGYRYLAFNNDNVLRCTGVLFNNSIINDYVFKCSPVTDITIKPGFIPSNNWVTYYFDVESQTENKTVSINKNIEKVPTNLLFDFPIEEAVEKGVASINIANLKTQVTPTGGPAPTDNSYIKNVITSN